MRNRVFTSPTGTRYVRVNRTRAKSLFCAGHALIVAPVNARIFGPWHIEGIIDPADAKHGSDLSRAFEQATNYARYYACCSELGDYLAYYVNEAILNS